MYADEHTKPDHTHTLQMALTHIPRTFFLSLALGCPAGPTAPRITKHGSHSKRCLTTGGKQEKEGVGEKMTSMKLKKI